MPKLGDRRDLTGLRFGKLIVIKFVCSKRVNKHNRLFYECLCDCGNKKIIESSHFLYDNTKSCGCNLNAKGQLSKSYTGIEELSGAYFGKIYQNAISRKLEFSISIEYIWNLFLKQERKCVLSGVPIILQQSYCKNCKLQTASLDRIDSFKGYVESNVQWVHKIIQFMKQEHTDKNFINWCHIISDFQRAKNAKI
jgi:hypothetical protein